MKKKPTSPERDWLHVGSRSVTTSGFHAPPGPISEPLGMTVRKANLLSDYGDEASWSRRIEQEARGRHLVAAIPEEDEE